MVVLGCTETTIKSSTPENKQQVEKSKDYVAAKPEAMQRWRDMRFGLFIHWGPVSLKGTEIGWSRGREIPIEEYDNLYKQFNPEKFDAKEWVGIAKDAGMKYLVITSKHHDGFCLWDSEYTDYDIMSTPFRRDVLKELSEECRRQGIVFNTYYSIIDWYQADYLPRGQSDKRPTEGADFERYVTYMKNQLREIVTGYGPLGVMWFDGEWENHWSPERGWDLYRYVHSLQPGILVNNRVGKGRKGMQGTNKTDRQYAGDFSTPEQEIGQFNNDVPWETNMTICRQWAWKPNDKMKSLKECIHTLVRVTGGDGNFLFNVGPMPDGRIEPRQVERLREMGQWLRKYGRSIYGTRGGPFKPGPWGASTHKGNRIYTHVLDWRNESLSLPPIDKKVVRSSLMTGGKATVKQTQNGITITVPKQYRKNIDTIVMLELDGTVSEIAPVSVTSPWSAVQKKARTVKTAKSPVTENKQQRDKRMKWWREARFGMFIHWGLYAVPAGEWKGKRIPGIGEWIMERAKISIPKYEPLTEQFDPVKFDADEWVRIAKNAGMKYIVITSKHHDGFCLWDSKVTDYDIVDATPFKRDVLKELSKACRKKRVRLCFYHSIMDWHHPYAQGPFYPNYNDGNRSNPNFARYVENYMKPQLKELITNYGPVGVLWFDGEWIRDWTEPQGKDLYNYVRSLQPEIIINNRVGKGRGKTHKERMQGITKGKEYAGDFGTPEQQIPPKGLPGVDWESCMTMNDTWGYKSYDHNWKSTEDLLRKLVDIASKGGNFLLNVGPAAEGLIPGPSVERLKAIGKWMKINGESIYGTTASPLGKVPWGRCTAKPGKLYLHVFDWPKDGKLKLAGFKNKVKRAYLLADKKHAKLPLIWEDEGNLIITVPSKAPDPINTVVVLRIKGK